MRAGAKSPDRAGEGKHTGPAASAQACAQERTCGGPALTYREVLDRGKACLEAGGVAEAGLDAWYLLEYVLKRQGIPNPDRGWYFLHCGEEIPQEHQGGLEEYRELIGKRARRIPLQQLTGEQEFMGLPFAVNEHVLIPRQDTEVLVEEALGILKPGMEVLDVCTGSGCMILSLDRLCPGISGTGTDLSPMALDVARENGRRLGSRVRFLEGDLFEPVEGEFDVIVSNPPYIPTEVIGTLMDEVRLHEPRVALDGAEDGLAFYRRLASEALAYLKPGGRIFLEIGSDQGEAVKNLLQKAGFCNVYVKKDLAGLDRVAAGWKPQPAAKPE